MTKPFARIFGKHHLPAGALSACLLALALLLMSGCVAPMVPPMRAVMAASPEDYLSRSLNLVQMEGPRNKVLNLMRAGTVALGMEDYQTATRTFEEAANQVLSIFADTPSAAKARKLWYEEGVKDFKGEPYERAMALFFRGLLYYRDGEYDNARACFRSAQFQDALAEEEQYRCDFLAMDWLEALCNARMGDMDAAADALRRAREVQRPIPTRLPDIHPDSNTLVAVFLGGAPIKQNTGPHGERLVIIPDSAGIGGAKVRLNGQPLPAEWVFDSVSYQATTRGGRAIDYIQGRKATFKTAGHAAAGIGGIAGAGMLGYGISEDNDAVAMAGAGLLAAGVLTDFAASQIRTAADTRYWDTLPDAMYLCSLRLPPGRHRLEISYTDRNGNLLFSQPQRIDFEIPQGNGKNNLIIAWSNPPQYRYVKQER